MIYIAEEIKKYNTENIKIESEYRNSTSLIKFTPEVIKYPTLIIYKVLFTKNAIFLFSVLYLLSSSSPKQHIQGAKKVPKRKK